MKCFLGKKHRGDTLVEVSLAIGIFSMVAIAAVSVINGSTNGAQSSLESTITREEIDGQAEALRFIQSAYIAGGQVEDARTSKYATLWQNIASRAIDISRMNNAQKDAILKYNPTSCSELYNSGILASQKAFIINTRAMSSNNWSRIVVNYDAGTFRETPTYPRIVYNGLSSDELYDPANVTNYSITSAEGIYIIAVRDADGTIIVSDSGSTEYKSAYIDFYIRSCWFTPSADRPSTISTAVRLYDPDALDINRYQRNGVLIRYGANGATNVIGSMPQQFIFAGDTGTILDNQFIQPGWRFKYWTTNANGTGVRYSPGAAYSVDANLTASTSLTLYAQWEKMQINLAYNANGGSGRMANQIIIAGDTQQLYANTFTRAGYTFAGWNTTQNGTGTAYSDRAYYTVPDDVMNEQTVTLYAQWNPVPYTLTYDANGGSYAPAAQTCYLSSISNDCRVTSSEPSRSGYQFLGWSESSTAAEASYTAGSTVNITGNKTLYAVWRARNETLTVYTEWSSGNDYDSYMKLRRPDGSYTDASWSTSNIPFTYNGQTYSLITGAGDGRGSHNRIYHEKFTINTLGGKDYYYSIYNWSSPGTIGTDIKVTISGQYTSAQSFYSSGRPGGSCTYWNVFAYKDGVIVPRNTCTSSMEYNY